MDMKRRVKVEQSTSYDDWLAVRECFVKSFHRYPLYKYMVPDEDTREEFLRAYLEANYEVSVGTKRGILMTVTLTDDDLNRDKKIIGGIISIPPSANKGGCAIEGDEPFWKAYKRHGLEKICKEGLKRAFRYELWEDEQVGRKLVATGIRMWIGIFCAIAPEFMAQGLGTAVYKETIKIMAKYWVKQQNNTGTNETETENLLPQKLNKNELPEQLLKRMSLDQNKARNKQPLHNESNSSTFDLPKHELKGKYDYSNLRKTQNLNEATSVKDIMYKANAPLILAISHSDLAANFHKSNGFHSVSIVPFHDTVDEVNPFNTHVLVLDPFRTGRVEEISAGLSM